MTIARPIASCCCWPPDRSPPRRPIISASTGNSSNTASGILRCPRGSSAKPVSRFSRTVSSGKISRPCGTVATPELRARVGAQLADVLALPHDLAARIPCRPEIARSIESQSQDQSPRR